MNGRSPGGRDRYGREFSRGYDAPMWRGRGYDAPMRGGYAGPAQDPQMRGGMSGGAYDQGMRRSSGGYGWDYWWIGERAMPQPRYGADYDRAYRNFDESHRPRFSPVGGMYPHVGNGYAPGSMPRPIREGTWFSDWTRWF
jgi:hypothetical protein